MFSAKEIMNARFAKALVYCSAFLHLKAGINFTVTPLIYTQIKTDFPSKKCEMLSLMCLTQKGINSLIEFHEKNSHRHFSLPASISSHFLALPADVCNH
jgi:hypothetical protein